MPVDAALRSSDRVGTRLANLFDCLSCPQEPPDETLFACIALESDREILRTFLATFPRLADDDPGLAQLFQRFLTGPPPSAKSAWHYAFANLLHIRKNPARAGDALEGAVVLALHLMEEGLPGAGDYAFPTAKVFLWGSHLLPPAQRIRVDSDGASAILELYLGAEKHVVRLRRTDGEWTAALPRLHRFGTSSDKISILPPVALRPGEFTDVFPLMVTADAGMAATCQQAFDLIADIAPEYQRWVTRLMRHIVLLKNEPSIIRSGSTVRHPGLSHLSYTDNRVSIAEMLIHEVSHQHFRLLERVGPLVDGDDNRLYYSPVKRTGRSLERILLAYHAFGNMLLFYRGCLQDRKLDRTHCARNVDEIEEQLRVLDEPLKSNPSLTDLGQSIYRPLAGRLSLG
jgi:HEXXH motif-containing protein